LVEMPFSKASGFLFLNKSVGFGVEIRLGSYDDSRTRRRS
jgi:hypothetical protein